MLLICLKMRLNFHRLQPYSVVMSNGATGEFWLVRFCLNLIMSGSIWDSSWWCYCRCYNFKMVRSLIWKRYRISYKFTS